MEISFVNYPLWSSPLVQPLSTFFALTESTKRVIDNYWSKLDSIIISHTSSEGSMFAIKEITSDDLFANFLYELFPEYTSPLVDEMIEFYPIEPYSKLPFPQKARLATFIRDAVITCNVRWVASAYNPRPGAEAQPGSYVLDWDTLPKMHGGDLLAHFLPLKFGPITIDNYFAKVYRNYFISFYKTGNPNTWRRPGFGWHRRKWNKVGNVGPTDHDIPFMSKVMRAHHGNLIDWSFESSLDYHIPQQTCDFWLDVQSAMLSKGGYVPPGGEVPSKFDPDPEDASGNYTTPKSHSLDFKEFKEFVVQEL